MISIVFYSQSRSILFNVAISKKDKVLKEKNTERNMKKNHNAMIQIFLSCTELLVLFLVIVSSAAATIEPVLTITKSPPTTHYTAVGDSITYNYTVANIGDSSLTGNITVNDNRTGSFNITNSGLNVGQKVPGTATYTITQPDLDNGYVINSANATNNNHISNTAIATAYACQSPALNITKSASPATYENVGDQIAYIYNVTNIGNVNINGPIQVKDHKISENPFIISSADLGPGQSVTGTANYSITRADIDFGSVINLAYAIGSFNGKQITAGPSSQTVTGPPRIQYIFLTNDRDFEPNNSGHGGAFKLNNGGYNDAFGLNYAGYGGAVVPVPMCGSPMYGSEPYEYGSEPYGTTEVLKSESHCCKDKVSSSKDSKAKLSGYKAKACLSKQKHKNHSKHHKAEKTYSKHRKTGKKLPSLN
jgi:uncharacterized repeat protein (TIGR01451 family)